jgi:hypothetical protein
MEESGSTNRIRITGLVGVDRAITPEKIKVAWHHLNPHWAQPLGVDTRPQDILC